MIINNCLSSPSTYRKNEKYKFSRDVTVWDYTINNSKEEGK